MSYTISQVIIDYSMQGKKTEPIPNLSGDTKVSALKQKIIDIKGAEGVRLSFGGKQLQDDKKLSEYRIVSNSVIIALLRLRGGTQNDGDGSRNMDENLVKELYPEMEISKEFSCRANDVFAPRFDSCEKSEYYKAKMSCGHKWCGGCVYFYLDKTVNTNGGYKIKCPESDCDNYWHMNECFAAGNVKNVKKRQEFNRQINKNGIISNKDIGNFCPKEECGQFFFVDDKTKNRSDVQCPTCKYVFCQWCRLKWNGSNLCKNKKCNGNTVEVLKELFDCPKKEIWGITGVPSKRLCGNPKCKSIFEHNSGCKRVVCPQCKHMQCHICTRRWIGKPLKGNCQCEYCSSLGEDAPDPCSYNIKCTVVQN